MYGLGDNIYQRAVLREVREEVHLYTPWPQLYADLPGIKPLAPVTSLRTQSRNVKRGYPWGRVPLGHPRRLHYVGSPSIPILAALEGEAGVRARVFDLPAFPNPLEGERYVVVRPATVRSEWRADSRNPRPEYIAQAVEAVREYFHVVSVADLAPGKEWALDPLPFADVRYHAGELPVEALLGLVRGATAVIGGVGWLLPAALAYRVPMFLIYGGWGGLGGNSPDRLMGHPLLDTSRITQVLPDNFCACTRNNHECDKHIGGFDERARKWVDGLMARGRAAVAARAGNRVLPRTGPAV